MLQRYGCETENISRMPLMSLLPFCGRRMAMLVWVHLLISTCQVDNLQSKGTVIDYRNWHLALGRRFRSLKLWFVFRSFGAEGFRSYIRRVSKCVACPFPVTSYFL